MGDKFLGVGSGALNLGNGTARIYAASLGAVDLEPSKPVRTNSVRQLTSTYLPISDIIGLQTRLNSTLTNPYNGNLNVQNLTTGITPGVQVDLNTFIANTASSLIDVEAKTENITAVSQGPDVTTYGGAVKADSLICADIYDAATQTQIIQLSGTEINFAVTDLTYNGDEIATVTGLGSYLPLVGGTMSGAINMGTQEVNNLSAIRPVDTNVVYGRSATVLGQGTDNVCIGELAQPQASIGGCVIIGSGATSFFVAGVAIGQAAVGNSESVTIGHSAQSLSTLNVCIGSGAETSASKGVAVGYQSLCADNAVSVGRAATGSGDFSVVVGAQSSTGANISSVVVGAGSSSGAIAANCIGRSLTNSTAGSLLVAASSNLRADTTTCDLGTVAAPFQTLYLNSSISGPSNSRTADNIVSNAGASTSGNIASLSGTTGKVITDSGVAAASVVTGPASAVANGITIFSGTTGKIITDAAAGIGTIGAITLANTTTSTTTGTGALICAGGAGIAGTMTIGGVVTMTNLTDAASLGNGALVMSGGLSVAKSIICGASISLNNNVSCNTVNCTKINSTTPSLFWGYTSGGFAVSFTAATAKLVDTGTLTEIQDAAGEFTPTVATGRVEYTGATTRYFNVRIIFNVLGNASSNTYTAWVSKNGSLTQVAARNYNFTTATPAGYLPFEVFGVYQLSTGDTIQLAALYSATASVNVFDIGVSILPVI